MTTPRVLIVADDLTGALDAAAPFARRGVATRVYRAPPAALPASPTVVAVNLATRHLTAHEARSRVAVMVGAASRDFSIVFKKIDSTLRGHVAAETAAALAAADLRTAVVAPAVPAQGRTVRGGVVYVHGQPLAQTRFVADAVTPAPREPLAALLSALGLPVHGGFRAPAEPSLAPGLYIPDCENAAHLQACVARFLSAAPVLWVGAAGLADALAAALFGGKLDAVRRRIEPRPSRFLYVVGSRAEATRSQCVRLRSEPDCAVLEAPAGALDADHRALSRVMASSAARTGTPNRHLLLAIDGPSEQPPQAVAAALAASVLTLLPGLDPDALVVTGGDTADAVLAASRCEAVDLLGEVCPGIPVGRALVHGRLRLLVTKAGGFGDEALLCDLPQRLADAQS